MVAISNTSCGHAVSERAHRSPRLPPPPPPTPRTGPLESPHAPPAAALASQQTLAVKKAGAHQARPEVNTLDLPPLMASLLPPPLPRQPPRVRAADQATTPLLAEMRARGHGHSGHGHSGHGHSSLPHRALSHAHAHARNPSAPRHYNGRAEAEAAEAWGEGVHQAASVIRSKPQPIAGKVLASQAVLFVAEHLAHRRRMNVHAAYLDYIGTNTASAVDISSKVVALLCGLAATVGAAAAAANAEYHWLASTVFAHGVAIAVTASLWPAAALEESVPMRQVLVAVDPGAPRWVTSLKRTWMGRLQRWRQRRDGAAASRLQRAMRRRSATRARVSSPTTGQEPTPGRDDGSDDEVDEARDPAKPIKPSRMSMALVGMQKLGTSIASISEVVQERLDAVGAWLSQAVGERLAACACSRHITKVCEGG